MTKVKWLTIMVSAVNPNEEASVEDIEEPYGGLTVVEVPASACIDAEGLVRSQHNYLRRRCFRCGLRQIRVADAYNDPRGT